MGKKVSMARRIKRDSERIFNHYGFGLHVERDPETKRMVGLEVENDLLDEDNIRLEDQKKLKAMGWKYREVGRWFRRFDEEGK